LNTWYVGEVSRVGGPGPQAFLVEMCTPHAALRPHFHSVEQFQVFVGGEGTLGKDPIRPVLAFYTDAYTSYGPITAGADGLSFFTFRRRQDAGAHYMPESRGELAPSPRRRIVATDRDADRDGPVGIAFTHAGAGEPVPALCGAPPAERYALVLDGSLVADGVDAPQWSILYWDGPAAPVAVRAGGAGASVGIFTFDSTAPAP